MESQMFERCFVAVACEKGIRKYGSAMAFAKEIWPNKDEKNAAQTLYAIQGKSSKTGKPQKLRLDEAVLMVSLLDEYSSFASFCFEIGEKLRLGWKPQCDTDAQQTDNLTLPPKRGPLSCGGESLQGDLETVSGK